MINMKSIIPALILFVFSINQTYAEPALTDAARLLESGKKLFLESEDEYLIYKLPKKRMLMLRQAFDSLNASLELKTTQEALYFSGYVLERLYADTKVPNRMPDCDIDRTKEVSRFFERVREISPVYHGEMYILDPISKITALWGALAMTYIVRDDTDSAAYAFRKGKKLGGFAASLTEYCRNIMASCDQGAVLFVNGDNDTFPIWYLQFMEGFRRDIEVVNLNLANKLWYLKRIKERTFFGANPAPISFSDLSLTENNDENMHLQYNLGTVAAAEMHVNRSQLLKYSATPQVIDSEKMEFDFKGIPYDQNDGETIYKFRVQDKVVLDILKNLKFQRPLYFSTTVPEESFCGLTSYLRYEGLVMRVCPITQKIAEWEPVHPAVMERCLMEINNNAGYESGIHEFKINELEDEDPAFADIRELLAINYRWAYILYSGYMLEQFDDSLKSIEILNMMNKMIPVSKFKMSYIFQYQVAKNYMEAGAEEKFREYLSDGIVSCREVIKDPVENKTILEAEYAGRYYGPYRMTAHLQSLNKAYDDATMTLIELIRHSRTLLRSMLNNILYGKDEVERIQYSIKDIEANMDQLEVLKLINEGKDRIALETAEAYNDNYLNSEDENVHYLGRKYFKELIYRLTQIENARKLKIQLERRRY